MSRFPRSLAFTFTVNPRGSPRGIAAAAKMDPPGACPWMVPRMKGYSGSGVVIVVPSCTTMLGAISYRVGRERRGHRQQEVDGHSPVPRHIDARDDLPEKRLPARRIEPVEPWRNQATVPRERCLPAVLRGRDGMGRLKASGLGLKPLLLLRKHLVAARERRLVAHAR